MMKYIMILMLAAVIAGCTTDKSAMPPDSIHRIGFLAKDIMQHPIVAGGLEEKQDQFYFDLEDGPWEKGQIIVVYPVGMKIPTETGRRIKLTGSIEHISFKGGKVGNAGYSNDVFTLQSWKYLK
jgi:hypothetical protein